MQSVHMEMDQLLRHPPSQNGVLESVSHSNSENDVFNYSYGNISHQFLSFLPSGIVKADRTSFHRIASHVTAIILNQASSWLLSCFSYHSYHLTFYTTVVEGRYCTWIDPFTFRTCKLNLYWRVQKNKKKQSLEVKVYRMLTPNASLYSSNDLCPVHRSFFILHFSWASFMNDQATDSSCVRFTDKSPFSEIRFAWLYIRLPRVTWFA